MTPAAVFDLDGTLIRGSSAERLLLPYLVRRGVVGWRQLAPTLALLATLPLAGRSRALRHNKRWPTGVDADVVQRCMDDFLEEVVAPRWCSATVARLKSYREQGTLVFLLTGAPEFVAHAVGKHLEMDGVVATPLEIRHRRFTGRLAGPHRFAAAKRTAVLELASEMSLDLRSSAGFADHGSDLAFLECFGFPVAVAPDRRLRREALARGWDVLGCR